MNFIGRIGRQKIKKSATFPEWRFAKSYWYGLIHHPVR
ncbi:MAG: hypothetical protein BWX87_02199 [Bacteroidetes bacterium ADurb.Bin123]|jgi:hypothetical protein|nr:MAG: hypothetical protein BWX87_02199 [Bacteroidetes bacterium ADurb.Bin123]